MSTLAFGGYVGVVGFLGGFETPLNVVPLIERLIRIQGIAVGSRERFEAMNRAIEAQRLKPVVDRVFRFEAAAEALTLMEHGGHFGKIVVEI